jgi:tRNA dimethylallyltransferase
MSEGDTVGSSLPTVVVVLGPTAVGKSALSLELARELNAEIVNADSMQLYRGMDIGTAKLPLSKRQGVEHHLLDTWEISHTATVAEYQSLARSRVQEISERGKVPILVGGSGLYINAAIDDMRFPGVDAAIRKKWEHQLDESDAAALHDELAARDPAAAGRIERLNGRRIVRALEVIELTNAPYPADLGVPKGLYPSVLIGLNRDRAELDVRIEARVDDMLTNGFLDEVAHLLEQGLTTAPTASRALGYAQLAAHLRGDMELADAREKTIVATRRYVRKQLSWFLRDPRITWFPPPQSQFDTAIIARKVASMASSSE